MELVLQRWRTDSFSRVFSSLYATAWPQPATDQLDITHGRPPANRASVRISRRQISSKEAYFDRTTSGHLHNNPGSSLATCRVVADML